MTSRREWLLRSVALFLGAFGLLNLLRPEARTDFDTNLWWLDLRALPHPYRLVFFAIVSAALLGVALHPRRPRWLRTASSVIWILGSAVAAANAATYYALFFRGGIAPGLPIPFSALIAALFFGLWRMEHRWMKAPAEEAPPGNLRVIGGAVIAAAVFVVLQVALFGRTDYQRSADVAVVLGARAYPDGRLSDALEERVRTACNLYQEGRVKTLIFSGGPVDAQFNETSAMRRFAEAHGVPATQILEDALGLNTDATIRNTLPMLRSLNARRVLVVSHFYHLPRIKLAYQHEGIEVFTVPAREERFIGQTPYSVLREIPAWWSYYLHGFHRA